MPKAPGQSDFIYEAPPVDPDAAERGASPAATRVVYWVLAIVLIALFLLVAVGLHIPSE